MTELPKDWKIVDFESCIEQDNTPSKIKIRRSNYKEKGKFPIIDQGQEFIAGYSNDITKIFPNEGDSVIFGDHTRIIKFVNFPFCIGADGTKVLRVRKDLLIPKFFYYQLQWMPIENAGYSRHYRFLRRKKIIVPPLDSQRHIVKILEKAEDLTKKRKQANLMANKILQAVFLQMFGDPITNPKGWRKTTIREVTISHKQGFYTKSEYSNAGIRLVRITDITESGELSYDTMPYLYLDPKTESQFKVQRGDLLFARSGVSIGRCAIVEKDVPCVFGSYIIRFRFNNEKVNNVFLLQQTKLPQFQLSMKGKAHGSANPNINAENIKNLEIIVPPIGLQNQFAEVVKRTNLLIKKQEEAKKYLIQLFDSLISKAFKGEFLSEVHPEKQVTEQKQPSLTDFMNK